MLCKAQRRTLRHQKSSRRHVTVTSRGCVGNTVPCLLVGQSLGCAVLVWCRDWYRACVALCWPRRSVWRRGLARDRVCESGADAQGDGVQQGWGSPAPVPCFPHSGDPRWACAPAARGLRGLACFVWLLYPTQPSWWWPRLPGGGRRWNGVGVLRLCAVAQPPKIMCNLRPTKLDDMHSTLQSQTCTPGSAGQVFRDTSRYLKP